jgi:hypothetical protein
MEKLNQNTVLICQKMLIKILDDRIINIVDSQCQLTASLLDSPSHFSRIVHNYSDDRKGFVVWKDDLEERLV